MGSWYDDGDDDNDNDKVLLLNKHLLRTSGGKRELRSAKTVCPQIACVDGLTEGGSLLMTCFILGCFHNFHPCP